jgi:hypothetical protein
MATLGTTEARLNQFANVGRRIAPTLTAPFERVANTMTALGKAIASPITGAMDLISHAFESMVKLLSSIPYVGGLFAAVPTSIKAFTSTIKEQVSEMAATSREARRMGISVESLVGIQTAAGGAADAMARGVFHMARVLGEVAAGSKKAEQEVTALGFNAKALAALPIDQALAQVADKFQNLANPAERAYLAFKLFGKTGYELLPVLARGSAGLADAAQRAKDFGLGFDDSTAAAMERARRQLGLVDMLAKGLQRQLAIEMAPVVGEIAESFANWVKGMGGFKAIFAWLADKFREFVAIALEGIAKILDAFDALMKKFKEVGSVLNPATHAKMFEGIGAGDEFFQQLAQRLSGFTPEGGAPEAQPQGPSLADRLRRKARQFREGGRPSWLVDQMNQAARAGGEENLPNQHRQQVIEKAGELEEKLRAEIAAFGGAKDAAERWKLAQQGATPAMLANIDALIKEKQALEQITGWASGEQNIFTDFAVRVEALNRALAQGAIGADAYNAAIAKLQEGLQKSIADKAASVFEQTRTPLEKYNARIQELQGLLQSGAISWDIYERAVGAASMELINLRKQAEMQRPAAVQFGTQEASRAIINHQLGVNEKDPATLLRDALNEQKLIERRQLEAQERMADALDNLARQGAM